MKILPVVFEQHEIRRAFDEKTETWYFSVVDIIQVLTQQPDFQAARNYWKVLKNRLRKEGSEVVTNCNRLKMPAEDGKMRETDVASPETLLRLVQSVPSPMKTKSRPNPAETSPKKPCSNWKRRPDRRLSPARTSCCPPGQKNSRRQADEYKHAAHIG